MLTRLRFSYPTTNSATPIQIQKIDSVTTLIEGQAQKCLSAQWTGQEDGLGVLYACVFGKGSKNQWVRSKAWPRARSDGLGSATGQAAVVAHTGLGRLELGQEHAEEVKPESQTQAEIAFVETDQAQVDQEDQVQQEEVVFEEEARQTERDRGQDE